MNLLNKNDATLQDARSWSGTLGRLAAERPAVRAGTAFSQPDTALPSRLSAIPNHLRRRRRRQEHAADKLRAQEFVMGT
jgi:hypothetical protein